MLNNLQILRALAALAVVCAHIGRDFSGPAGRLFGFGIYGVDLFFVLSGFVMVYTTARRPSAPMEFMRNRVVRIVPLYWLLTIGLFGIALIRPELLGSTRADWGDLARSLLFVPFQKSPGAWPEPVLFVGWSLNLEMAFYALFALSLLIRDLRIRVIGMVGILFVLTIVGWVLKPNSPVLGFYLTELLGEFAFGMVIALGFVRGLHSSIRAQWIGAACCAAGLAWAALEIAHPTGLGRLAVWGLASAAVVLGAVLLEASGKAYRGRFGLLVGSASYAIYLSHPFVIGLTIKLSSLNFAPGFPSEWTFGIIALAAVVISGIAIHLLVELPLTAWSRKKLVRNSARSTADLPAQ